MNTINDPLNEREFELVNIIGTQLAANQRALSRHMNLSLGMTNILLRRLVTKGYIRIKQLDRRKVEYILTPKGFAEKMQKSIRYTIKTINSFGLIQQGIAHLISELYAQGARKFYILGTLDLTALIETELRKEHWKDCTFVKLETPSQVPLEGVLLVGHETPILNIPEGVRIINVVEQLAKDERVTGSNMPVEAH